MRWRVLGPQQFFTQLPAELQQLGIGGMVANTWFEDFVDFARQRNGARLGRLAYLNQIFGDLEDGNIRTSIVGESQEGGQYFADFQMVWYTNNNIEADDLDDGVVAWVQSAGLRVVRNDVNVPQKRSLDRRAGALVARAPTTCPATKPYGSEMYDYVSSEEAPIPVGQGDPQCLFTSD